MTDLGRRATTLLVLLTLLTGCFFSKDESSVLRGDEAAARGELDAALAEYRLAVRQGSDDAPTLARVAHTYAEMGRIDEAGDFYHQAVEQDPAYTDQAVSDMVRLARAAQDRADLFGLASAMETAMSLRPGITIQDMELPLARHYFRAGEYATALPYYRSTIAGMEEDTVPDVLFEAASAYDEVGDCRRALLHYEQYRRMIQRWQRGEVDWKIGSCSLRLAQELRATNERRGGSLAHRAHRRSGRATEPPGRGLLRDGREPVGPGPLRGRHGGVPPGAPGGSDGFEPLGGASPVALRRASLRGTVGRTSRGGLLSLFPLASGQILRLV